MTASPYALEIVNPSIDARGQRVKLEFPEGPVPVKADRRYARQVLTNLVANASKYSPEHSVIRLLAEPDAKMVRISVIDQGPGIPPEQQAGLFERFGRARRWAGAGDRQGHRRGTWWQHRHRQ